jgi:hypothetical protein
MVVSPRGRVEIRQNYGVPGRCCSGVYVTKFSRVTAHRLTISYVPGLTVYRVPPCDRTGTYRWKFMNIQGASDHLKLEKIHDACKRRVDLFAGTWLTTITAGAP